MSELRTAKAGDEISEAARAEYARRLGYRDTTELLASDFARKVQPKAEGDAGNWICITCGYIARHNMDRDSHVETRKNRNHVIAWHNNATGQIEEP